MVVIQRHACEFGWFADAAGGIRVGPSVGRWSAIAGDRRIGAYRVAVHDRAIAVAAADDAEQRTG